MLIVGDVGNTNVVFAFYDGDSLVAEWRCETNAKRTADQYAVWLLGLMAHKGLDPKDVRGLAVAAVVPTVIFSLQQLADKYFGVKAMVLGRDGIKVPIAVEIDAPEQAGMDRLVNSYEAFATYKQALIALDFGTGTTFDVVSHTGAYLGGAISPGIHQAVEAMYIAASRLPRIAVDKPDQVIGKATIPCMQSGVFWGYIGLIEGLVSRIRKEYVASTGRNDRLPVIATGGLASLFADETDCIDEIDPYLTLRGIKRVYEALTTKS